MYKIILYLMASLLCAGCSTAKVAEGTSSSVSHAFERGKYVYGTALAILSPAAIGGALVYDGITLGGLLSPSDTAKAVETATGYSSDPTTRAVGSIVGSTGSAGNQDVTSMASSALRANQVYQNAKLEQQFKKSMKELEKEQEQMLRQQTQDQNAIEQ